MGLVESETAVAPWLKVVSGHEWSRRPEGRPKMIRLAAKVREGGCCRSYKMHDSHTYSVDLINYSTWHLHGS